MPVNMRFFRNAISLIGVALATIGAILFLTVFLIDLFGMHRNPYIGIVFFLLLPAIFLLGLALIPLGVWLDRRRQTRVLAVSQWPRLDLSDPVQRRATVAVLGLTVANLVIVSLATYRGIEYMDT